MPRSWHTKQEKKLIKRFGGKPRKGFGIDGTVDGKPVEVGVTRGADRFRIDRDVHEKLVRKGGSYIFDDLNDNMGPRKVEAKAVSKKLSGNKWFEDRGKYDHRFVDVDDIF